MTTATATFRFKDRATQARYEALLAAGVSDRPARRAALRSDIIPRLVLRTDTSMMAQFGTLADQFDGAEDQLEHVTQTAIRHGYRPSANDAYMPALANFPGDPAAFVSMAGGEGHARKVCAERGEDCLRRDGSYIYRAPKRDRKPPKRLADDLVDRVVAEKVKQDPSLARRTKDLRNEVIEAHGAKE